MGLAVLGLALGLTSGLAAPAHAQDAPPPLVWESITPEPPIDGPFDPLAQIDGVAFIADTLVVLADGREFFHHYLPQTGEWTQVYDSFLPLPSKRIATFEAPPGADGFPPQGGHALFLQGVRSLNRWTDGGRGFPDTVNTSLGLPWRAASGRLGRAFDGSVYERNFVAYSDDHGASWTEGAYGPEGVLDYPVQAVGLAPTATEQRVVAAGYAGLSYSLDDGQTWTQSPVHGAYRCTSIAQVVAGAQDGGRAGRVVAWCIDYVADRAYLWASDDGGETWTRRHPWEFAGPAQGQVVAAPDGSLYAYLTDGAPNARWPVVSSTDGGETWHDRGEVWTEWPFEPRQITVGPDGRLYAGGTPEVGGPQTYEVSGGAFRTVEPVVVAAEAPPVPTDASGLSIWAYPNPSRSSAVTVRISGYEAGARVRVAVYDVAGRLVQVLHEGPALPDARLMLDVADLPPGTYLSRIEAGVGVETASFIVAD